MTISQTAFCSATVVRSFGTDDALRQQAQTLPADHSRISVERCVGELRAGRPVRIRNGLETRLVQAAETVSGEWDAFHALKKNESLVNRARLVLPMERLQYLGATVSADSSCDAVELAQDAATSLLFDRKHEAIPDLLPADALQCGALDLMKFAQVLPAAMVMELTDILAFDWTLEVSLDALQNYHHETASSLSIVARSPVPLQEDADAEFVVFRGSDGLKDQVAIVVGKPDATSPVPIRLHSACLTGDLFGSLKCDCGEQLRRAVSSFAETGGGVLLYLDQEGRGIGMSNKMRAYALQADGYDTVDADAVLGYGADERQYEIAARMVGLLGYARVSLLTNNPRKIAALEAQGIDVVDRVALVGTMNPHNERYLKAKVERAGHLAEYAEVKGK